jgi:hypothetical protein
MDGEDKLSHDWALTPSGYKAVRTGPIFIELAKKLLIDPVLAKSQVLTGDEKYYRTFTTSIIKTLTEYDHYPEYASHANTFVNTVMYVVNEFLKRHYSLVGVEVIQPSKAIFLPWVRTVLPQTFAPPIYSGLLTVK